MAGSVGCAAPELETHSRSSSSRNGLETFKPKTIFDVVVGYRFEGSNLFNTYPDQVTVSANTNNGTCIYPGASPFGYDGRFVYARAEILLNR